MARSSTQAIGLPLLSAIILSVNGITSEITAQSAPLRRPISNTNPLFVFNCYDTDPAGLERQYNAIPVDLRPHAAIVCQFYDDLGWEATTAQYLALGEALATKADQLGVWLFYWTGAADMNAGFSAAQLDQLYKHPKLLGTGWVETATGYFCFDPGDSYPWQPLLTEVSAAARNGGIFFWQDYTFPGWCDDEPKSLWTDLPKNVIDTFRLHKDNILLSDKHNTNGGGDFFNIGCILGYWTSDLAGAWGYHTEDFDWSSHGLVDDQKYAPKAGFGIDFMHAIPFGSCVFSGESPNNVYPMNLTQQPPAFKMVVGPLWSKIVKDTLIPTKQEVLSRMKVAIHANDRIPTQLGLNDVYKGLYGPTYDTKKEWWPSTGRYGMIPILPPPTAVTEFSKYPEVVHSNGLPWSTQAAKVSWFNARYAEEPGSSGDAWFYNSRNNWFITNPNEQGGINTTFKFDLKGNQSLSLGGDFTPFAFAIVKELPGKLNIWADNYQLDASGSVSSENSFIRKNVFRITGLSSEPTIDPLTAVKGFNNDNNFSYTKAWDATAKTFTITLNHNGLVDLTVNHADFQGGVATAARVRPARAGVSSRSIVNIISINGRVVMNRMSLEPRGITRQTGGRGAGVYFLQPEGEGTPSSTMVVSERHPQR